MQIGHATILHDLQNMSHQSYGQLRNDLTRTGHIGGSMAGAVLGVNPYCTKLRAWMMLAGELDCQMEETERMWCGRMVEPALREMFVDRTSHAVLPVPYILQHPQYPWMICTLDGMVSVVTMDGNAYKVGALELKNTNVYLAKTWADGDIADSAFAQVIHNMAVTGLPFGYVGVLIGGNRFEVRYVERDEALITQVIDRELAFWESLQRHEPPGYDAADAGLLDELYPPRSGIADGDIVELPEAARGWIDHYEHGVAAEKEGKRAKEEASTQLKALLQDHELGQIDDSVVAWQSRTRKGYTVQESSYRAFTTRRRPS